MSLERELEDPGLREREEEALVKMLLLFLLIF
jgi:hypothetical protein